MHLLEPQLAALRLNIRSQAHRAVVRISAPSSSKDRSNPRARLTSQSPKFGCRSTLNRRLHEEGSENLKMCLLQRVFHASGQFGSLRLLQHIPTSFNNNEKAKSLHKGSGDRMARQPCAREPSPRDISPKCAGAFRPVPECNTWSERSPPMLFSRKHETKERGAFEDAAS